MKGSDAENPGIPDPDVALMLAFQQGNEEAFVQLYRRHRDRVVNLGRRLLGSTADGEEAAQEVFLKLYNARARYTAQSRFLTFLLRIATNHCFNVKARHETSKRAPGVDVEQQSHVGNQSPENLTSNSELRGAIAKALAALPDNQAAAFVLCHFDGMSCAAAAEVLNVSEGAVKALVFRAREKLTRDLRVMIDDSNEVQHAVP